MSQKINLAGIVVGHYSTLQDADTNRTSCVDISAFYLLPIALAISGACLGLDLSSAVVDAIVNASAIFTGLLLNLLVLVYDQKSKVPAVDVAKTGWEKNQVRHRIINELYYNISYATLISLLVLTLSVIHLCAEDIRTALDIPYTAYVLDVDWSRYLTSPMLVFLGVNLLLTIFMVLRRIYSLLIDGT